MAADQSFDLQEYLQFYKEDYIIFNLQVMLCI